MGTVQHASRVTATVLTGCKVSPDLNIYLVLLNKRTCSFKLGARQWRPSPTYEKPVEIEKVRVSNQLTVSTSGLHKEQMKFKIYLFVSVQRVLRRGRVGAGVGRRELPYELSSAHVLLAQARRSRGDYAQVVVDVVDVVDLQTAGVDAAGAQALVDYTTTYTRVVYYLLRVYAGVAGRLDVVAVVALPQLAADKPNGYHRTVAPDHLLVLQVQPGQFFRRVCRNFISLF